VIGTDGSNPAPSGGESVANLISSVEDIVFMHAALVPSSVSIVLTDGLDDDTHDKALLMSIERWPATDLLGL
jgi:hypothetical protein